MSRSVEALLIGISTSIATAAVCGAAWAVAGVFTGIIGMCQTAPVWWVKTYLLIGLTIPVGSVIAGCYFAKKVTRLR